MLDLVRTETFSLGLVDLLSHALLFIRGMAMYHVLEPGGGHLEPANIITFGIISLLFGSMLFSVEIYHMSSCPALLRKVTICLDDWGIVFLMHQYSFTPAYTTFSLPEA